MGRRITPADSLIKPLTAEPPFNDQHGTDGDFARQLCFGRLVQRYIHPMLVLGSPNHVAHWADLPCAFFEILKLEKTDLTDTVLTGTELDSVKTLEMAICVERGYRIGR